MEPLSIEDVSSIFDTPTDLDKLFPFFTDRVNNSSTIELLDKALAEMEASWLDEAMRNNIRMIATYKRRSLQPAPQPAAPMEVMNDCINTLNASKTFTELQDVIQSKAEVYKTLNKWQSQIINNLIDELSKTLPKEITPSPTETNEQVWSTDSNPIPDSNIEPVVNTSVTAVEVKPKRTRKVGKPDWTTQVIEVTPEYEALQEERMRERIASKVITINRRVNLPINGVQYSNNETIMSVTCSEQDLDESIALINRAIKTDTRFYMKEDVEKARAEWIEEGKKLWGSYQAGVIDGIVTQNWTAELELEKKANEHFRWFLNLMASNPTEITLPNGLKELMSTYVRAEYSEYCKTNPNPKTKK